MFIQGQVVTQNVFGKFFMSIFGFSSKKSILLSSTKIHFSLSSCHVLPLALGPAVNMERIVSWFVRRPWDFRISSSHALTNTGCLAPIYHLREGDQWVNLAKWLHYTCMML